MASFSITEFKGLNAAQAALTLPLGEATNIQNVRQRPFTNWQKRQGISFSTAGTSPVMGIFNLELDNVVVPIVQNGSALTFFPDLSTLDGVVGNPDPYPFINPISSDNAGGGGTATTFLVEQTMRAIQDRRTIGGHAVWSWPNLIFKSDGTRWNGNTGISVANYPANNIYGPDLTYHDAFYGNPSGTRAAALVNDIISACHDTVTNVDYIQTISGETSVTLYTTSIFPALSSATRANFKGKLTSTKTGIRLLTTLKVAGDQIDVETKSGVATDGTPCGCNGTLASCYKIDTVPTSQFNGSCNVIASGAPAWNGEYNISGVTCVTSCTGWAVTGPASLDGFAMTTGYEDCSETGSYIGKFSSYGAPCWIATIQMDDSSGNPGVGNFIWFQKDTGDTPVGTYLQIDDSGCLITSGQTITVSAC